MPRSGIREVMELANAIPDAIRLETGEPNFDTPRHICEAASTAASDGFTKYTPNAGIAPLREALATKVRQRNGISATAEQVVVTTGAVSGIYSSMVALVDPGSEMLLGDPSWPNYAQMMRLLKIKPVYFPLRSEYLMVPQATDIEPLITARTKAIMLNSPGNPTGGVTPGHALEEIMELARRHDLLVFSDEVYDELSFDQPHVSAAPLDTDGRVITFFSFSKTYAMTGWRVGYLVVPPGVSPLIVRAQEPITSCVNAPAQMAALAAVIGPQECVSEMRAAYQHRRDLVTDLLSSRDITHIRPRGAFYLMIDVSASGNNGADFVHRLLGEKRVAVVPGDTFGPDSGRFVRISLATATEPLLEGVNRIADAIHDWSG